jgi:endoglucanase
MIAPDLVEVEIQAGQVEYGRQVPYERRDGDRVETRKDKWVSRGGTPLGALAGAAGAVLHTHDRLVGAPLDPAWADRSGSYRLTSSDDARFKDGLAPTRVDRKSKPTDLARTGPWQFAAPVRHHLFLQFAAPLQDGQTYVLSLADSAFPTTAFRCDARTVRSSAVHVSQIGFRPDDPAKVAFLSCWKGSGGPQAYAPGMPFEIVDEAAGTTVLKGTAMLSKAMADQSEDAYKKNHNGTDVFLLDFSALERPGSYRVVVPGVGCSYPFAVAAEVWQKAFIVSARGFYHQRSGIAMGPPFTTYERPRPMHPDDGVKVFASTCGLMDSGNGLDAKDSNFGNLVKGKTETVVPDAWGGYMDAGDWDRRIQHLNGTRLLLELAEFAPAFAAQTRLNLPESGNGLPDLVNEARFNLDCYRRLQTADGGIRGGIESAEHPRQGEASWQESLPLLAYAPCVWSSYVYAGVAARAARWFEAQHPEPANPYRESALRAMQWAEAHLAERGGKGDPPEVNDSRNLAAAELYRLTGDPAWHTLFLATTVFSDPAKPLQEWQKHDGRDAAWVYLRLERPTDARIRTNCRAALLREADERVARGRQTGFRWTGNPWAPVAWGALAAPDGITLARAHQLTGEAKYLTALVLACQFGAGANPSNLCYTTGVGRDFPQHPLHVDSRISNQPAPAGLTVFGPADPVRGKDSWEQKLVRPHIYPDVLKWPAVEAFWDVFWYPSMCEYTVDKPMAANAYAWGYLASRQ